MTFPGFPSLILQKNPGPLFKNNLIKINCNSFCDSKNHFLTINDWILNFSIIFLKSEKKNFQI